jgi:hypothetical protein
VVKLSNLPVRILFVKLLLNNSGIYWSKILFGLILKIWTISVLNLTETKQISKTQRLSREPNDLEILCRSTMSSLEDMMIFAHTATATKERELLITLILLRC